MGNVKLFSNHNSSNFKRMSVLLLALIFFFFCSSAFAQDYSDYEYEPGEGLHQEEWYDPSDWFDTGEGIDYETDWDNYYYGYDEYDDWNNDYSYSPYYGYAPDDPYGLYDQYEYDYYTDQWYEDDPFDS